MTGNLDRAQATQMTRRKAADDHYRRCMAAAQPVVDDLKRHGFRLLTPSGVLGDRHPERAVPILLEWLPRIAEPAVKSDMASVLAALRLPADAFGIIADEFRRVAARDASEADDPAFVSGALADALVRAARPAERMVLLDLALDRRYGIARGILVRRLGRSRDPQVAKALTALLGDEEGQVRIDAAAALATLAIPETRQKLEAHLRDPERDVRRAVSRALERIDRRTGDLHDQ